MVCARPTRVDPMEQVHIVTLTCMSTGQQTIGVGRSEQSAEIGAVSDLCERLGLVDLDEYERETGIYYVHG